MFKDVASLITERKNLWRIFGSLSPDPNLSFIQEVKHDGITENTT